jgi:hypothetical protein
MNQIKRYARNINTTKNKVIAGAALLGSIALTEIKDNVHIGYVTIHNPKENNYVIGLYPRANIEGQGQGNITTIGLVTRNNINENSQLIGNQNSYSLINSSNKLKENAKLIGNQNSFSLFRASNKTKDNTVFKGQQFAYGIGTINELHENSKYEANQHSRGTISKTQGGTSLGFRSEIGLEKLLD